MMIPLCVTIWLRAREHVIIEQLPRDAARGEEFKDPHLNNVVPEK